jgi:hypothetical protein
MAILVESPRDCGQVPTLTKERFSAAAREYTSAEDIFNIIQTISAEFNHDDDLVELATKLRQKNLGQLLSNESFRAQLDNGGKDALWQQLDELSSMFLGEDIAQKWYTLCPQHTQDAFHGPVDGKGHCKMHNDRYNCTGGKHEAHEAWVKK